MLTELHCSGYIQQITNRIINFYFKQINKANLKIIAILVDFINIVDKKLKNNNPILLRNDQLLRNHFNNLICIFTFSPKYKLVKLPNIKPNILI